MCIINYHQLKAISKNIIREASRYTIDLVGLLSFIYKLIIDYEATYFYRDHPPPFLTNLRE